ncbi:MAG: hypothetical protein ACJAZW_000394 [Maritalea sp.]|jgi:hypothetical protein
MQSACATVATGTFECIVLASSMFIRSHAGPHPISITCAPSLAPLSFHPLDGEGLRWGGTQQTAAQEHPPHQFDPGLDPGSILRLRQRRLQSLTRNIGLNNRAIITDGL